MEGHAFATLGRAEVALQAGDLTLAGDLVERFLRQVPPGDLMERVDGLELALRVSCGVGNLDQAKEMLAELVLVAEAANTPSIWGAVSSGRGHLSVAAGELELARRSFEDAVDLFLRSGAPFETAKARIDLARVLAAPDRMPSAASQARRAFDSLNRMGAIRESAHALSLLKEIGAANAPDGTEAPLPSGLTRREVEVLGLLAQGMSNQEIARFIPQRAHG